MDFFVGQTLSGRYEILDLIGEGGMALVYRANDLLLGRVVAVKVLRPQFASDLQFVERFRREAQAAARLSHTNVVNIYDVGQDQGTHFIIMECVQGQNLKTIIEETAPLPVDKVVEIGVQITRALEHAHSKNVVHRDIKPHNILITDDGVVKVTDFGIARAVSSSTLTQTGTIIGSVHYFSPEQAKGANIGPQSDLYSLGIVLYEMLVGKVPYTGESAIAIAMKHAQDTVPSVRTVNPAVPVYLDRVVQKAMSKDLVSRYNSAQELRRDLEQVLWQELEQAPGAKRSADFDETRVLRRPSVDREEKKVAKSGSVWKKLILGLVFLAIAAASFIFVILPAFLNVEEVIVPRLIGLDYSEAQKTAARVGLSLEVDRKVYDANAPQNQVVDQDPRPNRWIKVNRKIKITLSLGPELATTPDLIGLTPREAQVALSSAGLSQGQELTEFSSEVPQGRIMLQNPPPFAKVGKGSPVDITLSKGPAPDVVVVPDFSGMPFQQALQELKSVGLVPGRVITEPRPGRTAPPGSVLDQNPPPGVSVPPGSKVDFVVSPEADLPEPTQTPTPTPAPGTGVEPQPEPEPLPGPQPQPQPVPEPMPEPEPTSPGPEPQPQPQPEPAAPDQDQFNEPDQGSGDNNQPEPQPPAPPVQETPVESPINQIKRAEIQILVPPGPIRQLVQIIVIDSYPAREVYSRVHGPGDRIVQIVEGYGPTVKIQVYIDGVMYKEQTFKE